MAVRILLELGEETDKFQLKLLDLVVDLIEFIENGGDFVGLGLREVVVALEHLQLLYQG